MMELIPFALVITSAVSHAVWNMLAKGGSDKEAFLWWSSFTAIFTLLPVFYILIPDWGLPMAVVPHLVMSGVTQVLYLISLGKAYEMGDLSVTYPLARSSPIFLFVLAVLFLSEDITLSGAAGILLIVLGIYMIHMKDFSVKDFLKPVTSLRARSSQFALMAALCTSIYSLVDKMGVSAVPPLAYAFWLDIFIVAFLTPAVWVRCGWKVVTEEWKDKGNQVLASGFLMMFGYVLVLVAMSMTQVSYILALRQLSIVIGVIFGVGFLRERYWRIRVLSSIMMFLGVLILGLMT